MRTFARLITAGLVVAAGQGGTPGMAQRPPSAASASPASALDVPYLPQSVLLCGGAAVAMVERWWGRRGVYAEDFAGLVRPALGGILTTELDSATRARGWATRAFRGSAELVRQFLADGVPVVALIRSGRDQFHYVVILAWHDGEVVFHDPADAPFISVDEARFLARWDQADRWALVIRPPPPAPLAPGPASTPIQPFDSLPCRPWLDQALDAVAAGRLDEADRLLAEAGRACPAEPLLRRELAGVRFKQGQYAEASRLGDEYLRLVPGDSLGWQLLATSRYLAGDGDGALRAWNRIGRPTVDLLRIGGLRSTRFQVLAGAVAVPHGTMLTPAMLGLARRRLSDVPALRDAGVTWQAVPGGQVEVQAMVVERPVIGRAWRLGAATAIGALAQQEVGFEVASPTGAGELWTAKWRWEPARPLRAVRVDLPVTLGIPGVVEVAGAWERARIARDPAGLSVVEDTWRSARLGFGGWVTTGVRPAVGLGLERWSGGRNYLVAAVGAEFRARGDRLRVEVTGTHAASLSGHALHRRGGARAMWASSLGLGRAAWSARLGGDWASVGTPIGAWPVAGGNLSRAIPLRAEPSPRNGLLAGRASARAILHGGLTGDHPVRRVGPLVVAVGAFLDGARVAGSADEAVGGRFYLDGGIGIRIGVAEGDLGVVRVDLARGLLADRRSALTVGVHRRWPPFTQASR